MSGHGGARAGAGRPKKAELYAPQIRQAENRITDQLPQLLHNLLQLAHGGFDEVENEYQPAGLITIQKTLETADGVIRVSELAYPERDPAELVCIRRKVRTATPDRKANEYLLDRILGRPTQAIESDATLSDPDQLIARFEVAVTKIYGRDHGSTSDGSLHSGGEPGRVSTGSDS